MSRTDTFGETASIQNFQAISTPRRIRLVDYDKATLDRLWPPWDYLRIHTRADADVYVALNGATAASTASTSLVPSFVTTPNAVPIFGIKGHTPLEIWSSATSLSIQATGATAVGVSIFLGRH